MFHSKSLFFIHNFVLQPVSIVQIDLHLLLRAAEPKRPPLAKSSVRPFRGLASNHQFHVILSELGKQLFLSIFVQKLNVVSKGEFVLLQVQQKGSESCVGIEELRIGSGSPPAREADELPAACRVGEDASEQNAPFPERQPHFDKQRAAVDDPVVAVRNRVESASECLFLLDQNHMCFIPVLVGNNFNVNRAASVCSRPLDHNDLILVSFFEIPLFFSDCQGIQNFTARFCEFASKFYMGF
ncbi:hypothetical protein WR25_08839 [Diploscapter pachys]|uniref:Uncharacterized protein n=1 Tax=Diploscapter pachys TaxID=2018661 RepID=A0A2A2JB27_9BILA|nr:hypothetical protein WR25_08839 [Diploscapter pachys]